MTEYQELHDIAVTRGWRVPITQPIDHDAWYHYWAVLLAIANGQMFVNQPPEPPDNITFMERTQARSLGRTKYWTGRQCSRGHMHPRYTASGACGACVTASQRRQKPAGMITFRALIHKEDEGLLQQTVAFFNKQRGL